MLKFLTKIFGTQTERQLKELWPIVEKINQHYAEFKDIDLLQKTEEFRKRIADEETLDDIMPEAFALVKEACRRLVGKKWQVVEIETEWNMIPYDVQLIGAIVLHKGKIAEMKTGEGKTLVATMPLYLNGLSGKGAHLITVNDYLARRDREWMGPVYESLGFTVGVLQGGMEPALRKEAYQCDITYGTNNEFGFDYLRDNMVWRLEDKVQPGHNYAIVDEVDSILVDEARTPLIISGPVEHETKAFNDLNPVVQRINSAQTVFVNRVVAEAKRMLDDGADQKDIGKKLLQARRGSPKNRQLLKLEQENPPCGRLARATLRSFIEAVTEVMQREITVDEAAVIAGTSPGQIRRMISQGKLRARGGNGERVTVAMGEVPVNQAERMRVFEVVLDFSKTV